MKPHLRRLISLCLVAGVAAGIWYIGPLIAIANKTPLLPETNRWLAILVLVLIWGFQNLATSTVDVSELDDEFSDGEVSKDDISLLKNQFRGAIQFLKRTTIKNQEGESRLHQLPWYLILGPSGSGKSTLLANSGLKFILSKQATNKQQQPVESTRLCDWWVTREAVFLDTAGRFNEDMHHNSQQRQLWQTLLHLIRGQRRHAINGIIIAFNIADLAKQSKEAQQQLAKRARALISDTHKQLRIQIPIYILFTKTDLIAGFNEYFADLNQEERRQIWGITLPDDKTPRQRRLLQTIDDEYNKLLKRLNERLIWRLHHERNTEKRALIEEFPTQMENIKKQVLDFCKQLSNNARSYWWRGIYFTSGTQKDTPADYVLAELTESFELQPYAQTSTLQQEKTFFAIQLFKNLIFKEAELINYNKHLTTFKTWMRRSAYAMAFMAIVTCVLIWSKNFSYHVRQLSYAQNAITEYKLLSQGLTKDSSATGETLNNNNLIAQQANHLVETLPSLNAIHKAVTILDDLQVPWMTSAIVPHHTDLEQTATLAYHQALQNIFINALAQQLEAQIEQGQTNNPGLFYGALEVYLMLAEPQNMSRPFITEWLSRYWQQIYPNNKAVQQQLLAHLNILLHSPIKAIQIDPQVLAKVRTTMQQHVKDQQRKLAAQKTPAQIKPNTPKPTSINFAQQQNALQPQAIDSDNPPIPATQTQALPQPITVPTQTSSTQITTTQAEQPNTQPSPEQSLAQLQDEILHTKSDSTSSIK